jgi:hypothetical protein
MHHEQRTLDLFGSKQRGVRFHPVPVVRTVRVTNITEEQQPEL